MGARGRGSAEHLSALVVLLKAFNRLGYFPVLDEVPAEVVGHIRRDLRLPEHVAPVYASARTAERHRSLVRARSEAVHDPAGARKVAADAIDEAARRKNEPADLINIALERLVEGSYELPAFRTLNDMAITIRVRVNEGNFATVLARLGDASAARLERLLQPGPGGKSELNQLKRPRAAAVVVELPQAVGAPAVGGRAGQHIHQARHRLRSGTAPGAVDARPPDPRA